MNLALGQGIRRVHRPRASSSGGERAAVLNLAALDCPDAGGGRKHGMDRLGALVAHPDEYVDGQRPEDLGIPRRAMESLPGVAKVGGFRHLVHHDEQSGLHLSHESADNRSCSN